MWFFTLMETSFCCKMHFTGGLLNSIVSRIWSTWMSFGWFRPTQLDSSTQGRLAHSGAIGWLSLERPCCQRPQRDQHLCKHRQPLAFCLVALWGQSRLFTQLTLEKRDWLMSWLLSLARKVSHFLNSRLYRIAPFARYCNNAKTVILNVLIQMKTILLIVLWWAHDAKEKVVSHN